MISMCKAICMAVEDLEVVNYTGYPGTPVSHIGTYMIRKYPKTSFWSTNEKVALENAFGMSFAQKSTVVSMKTLGLNVACDMLTQMSNTALNAPIVIVLGDDVGRAGSDDGQDGRQYAQLCNIPLFEPSSPQEAYDFTLKAFELSDKYSVPVLIRLNTILSNMSASKIEHRDDLYKIKLSNYENSTQMTLNNTLEYALEQGKCYEIDNYHDYKNLHSELLDEIDNSKELLKKYYYNKPTGIICAGYSSNALIELNERHKKYDILKLGITFPFNMSDVADFCSNHEKLIVLEDGKAFIGNNVKKLGYKVIDNIHIKELYSSLNITNEIIRNYFFDEDKNYSNTNETNLFRFPECCNGCSHTKLSKIVYEYRDEISVVSGIGCYAINTMPLAKSINVVKCMGAPIAVASAYNKSSENKQMISIIGDGEFWHTGINGLIDAKYNSGELLLIIQDNNSIAMTGGQITPSSNSGNDCKNNNYIDLCKIISAIGVDKIAELSNPTSRQLAEVFEEYLYSRGIRVIINKQKCIKYFK